MTQTLPCPQCGKVYRNIPAKYYGQQIQCRDCSAVIDIPSPDAVGRPTHAEVTRKKPATNAQSTGAGKKRKKKSRQQKQKTKGWSLRKVYLVLAILVCAATWMEMAAAYARDIEGWLPAGNYEENVADMNRRVGFRRSRGAGVRLMVKSGLAYAENAVVKLPRLPQVFLHTFTRAWGVLILFVAAQAVLGGVVWGMKVMGNKLEGDDRKLKRDYPELG